MAGPEICIGIVTTIIPCLASKIREEFRYLRNYKSYVGDFETIKGRLSAAVETVDQKITEAGGRNEYSVLPDVADWLKRANTSLQQDTKPTKYFGLCVNCRAQIKQAKELEGVTKTIASLIEEAQRFDAFARAVGVPGMTFYSQEFFPFESRREKFEELKKELVDKTNYMIGLQGSGGTGKSTMAIEVGKHVEKSNSFDRVIFISVSTPVDEKEIRDEIARQLELQLEEEKFLTHAQQIWTRIAHAGNTLVILDDVWEELNLNNIGIQHGTQNKVRCCVLLTTRLLGVCASMECQKTLQLETLPTEDALNLFLAHTTANVNHCPDDLKKVARDIVNKCGKLPVMIVAVAKTFKILPQRKWKEALTALKNPMPLEHGIVDEHTREVYNSLQFSYTYLNDEKAQDLFLLCSIFPNAYEIPVELLSRIAIGLGLLGEAGQYYIASCHVLGIIDKLINSSLLLKAGEEYVKMHDVIREMALREIGNEKIQVIMDSKIKLKNVEYSSWIINGFPNYIDDSKLRVLLVWINTNEYSLKVSKKFFEGMKSLRVLLFHSKVNFGRTSALLLPKSIQSLQNIRTLSLKNWELGDISVLIKSLKELESLELINCSISELPSEISKLTKLRSLCMIHCSFEVSNSFDVTARCRRLEELYYVSNDFDLTKLMGPQITSLPEYQIYHIDNSDFSITDFSQLDTSIKRSFKPAKLQKRLSEEMIKSLVARAEIVRLEGYDEAWWGNLIPDMISINDGAMEDLINLSLIDWPEMKCLIHTKNLQLNSGVTIFFKLVELQLYKVGLSEICCGNYPDGFLKHLEKLELKRCGKLENSLFKGNLYLGNLRSINIEDCSMTYLFHQSTAQSLRHLETLKIVDSSELKYIIMDEGPSTEEIVMVAKDPNPRTHDSLFQQLKLLSIQGCHKLQFILPVCYCEDLPLLESLEISNCQSLRYMFGKYPEDGGLHQMKSDRTLPSLKETSIENVPLFVNIYPDCYLPRRSPATNTSEGSKEQDSSESQNVSRCSPLSCFMPRSMSTSKNEPSISKTAPTNSIDSQEKYVGDKTHGIFRPPLYPCNLRKMNIIGDISNLRSLFSVSIASSMSLLEELIVSRCDDLEYIVMEEVDSHDHTNANSIFPNLRTIEIKKCQKLESISPASCSRNLVRLESMLISEASNLRYVFGKSHGEGDDNSPHQNKNIEIDLSALNKLCLNEVDNIVSMCPENYHVKALSLRDINLGGCPQLPINSFIDLSVVGHEGQERRSREKLMGMHLCNLEHLALNSLEMETMYDLERLRIASPVDSSLKTLELERLTMLRNLCVAPKHLFLTFQNLSKLIINRCHQLKFIFPASVSRSLPYLKHLQVSACEELERIIEKDNDDHKCCFPNLLTIYVESCDKLKCLFSVSSCTRLPQLSILMITLGAELEQVFEYKGSATQELDIEHVFPRLLILWLLGLPKLHSICKGIEFKTVIYRIVVVDCPNLISLTPTTHSDFLKMQSYWNWIAEKSTGNKGNLDHGDIFELLINRIREDAEKKIKRDPSSSKKNNASDYEESPESEAAKSPQKTMEATSHQKGSKLYVKEIGEASDDEEESSESKAGESPQKTMEETFQGGSKLDDEVALTTNQIMKPESSKASPSEFVVASENEDPHDNLIGIDGKGRRITLNQQERTTAKPDMHPDDDSQKNIEASVRETSNEIAMAIPSTTTEMSFPLVPSSFTPNKPEITASSTQSKSDIYSASESAQDGTKITTKADETYIKQLENDDLMTLFNIIEGADMEVQMPSASKITALEYDSEVPKALADLEASFKMGLNEIASSEENRLCLENSLNTLSSHCSHDGLKATIHSLQQEIQTVLASFKLEQKERAMVEQYSQRKGAAMTLISEIHKTENSMVEAQTMEAKLKEQISKLQAELYQKENEIKECKIKLSSLQEERKKGISDTIGFMKELEGVKKERSHSENVECSWSSCLANLKKTSLLLGVHLRQKL